MALHLLSFFNHQLLFVLYLKGLPALTIFSCNIIIHSSWLIYNSNRITMDSLLLWLYLYNNMV